MTEHTPRQNSSRVLKACDRCRVRKSKCDSDIPCSKCKAENADCVSSKNIKSRRKTNQSASYVELLQSELKMMTAGVQKMYCDLQKQGIWPDTHASDTYRHSSTESILEALGIAQDKIFQGPLFDPIENHVRIPQGDQIDPTNKCDSAMSRKAAEEIFGYIEPVLSQAFADVGMPQLWNPSWDFASCMLDDANLIGDLTPFDDDTV